MHGFGDIEEKISTNALYDSVGNNICDGVDEFVPVGMKCIFFIDQFQKEKSFLWIGNRNMNRILWKWSFVWNERFAEKEVQACHYDDDKSYKKRDNAPCLIFEQGNSRRYVGCRVLHIPRKGQKIQQRHFQRW